MLKPGDTVTLCEQVQGLKKGEHPVCITGIEIVSVRRERLDAITPEDVAAEGFPGWSPEQFIKFFCDSHKGCAPSTMITRIEWADQADQADAPPLSPRREVTRRQQVPQEDPADAISQQAAAIRERLAAIKEQLDAYAPGIWSRRGATDGYHDTAQKLSGAGKFLSGEYDKSYAGPWGPYSTLQGFREHYAAECLRDALHYLVWAERNAGLRTEESAMSLDPFRQPREDTREQLPGTVTAAAAGAEAS